mmetsp:Transcript_74583/g.192448  ORF Transcript_74583/g.192448 Transcript_74583/m.192448 type:complete len:292 (+) Transcript_74583:470-1345(+)
MLLQYAKAASMSETSVQSRDFMARLMSICLCGALPVLLTTSSMRFSRSLCGSDSRRSLGRATNFFSRSTAICWSTRSQSPTQRDSQFASFVDAKSTKIFGVMGMIAYSKRHAISNLHMSVNSGRSTDVAKSMSQTASRASIMMFAALRSPCARPMRGISSFVAFLDMSSSFGLIVFTTRPLRSGHSPPKFSLNSLRIVGSGAYSPFLQVSGLNLLSLPFSEYQPQSSGLPAARCRPLPSPPSWLFGPPLRSDDTTPPGPKVSASTLLTLPNGRTSSGDEVPTMPAMRFSLS